MKEKLFELKKAITDWLEEKIKLVKKRRRCFVDDYTKQKKLTDSSQTLTSFLSEEEKERHRNKVQSKWHLEEAVKLYLNSLTKNSIELDLILAYFTRIIMKLENKDVCYFKRMNNGRLRVFKKVYCELNIEAWKKCPEFKCIIWKDPEAECPYENQK
jgi:hypothetical protein